MSISKTSGVTDLINFLKASRDFSENVAHLQETEPRDPVLFEMPPTIHPLLSEALQQNGINHLYSHQLQAYKLAGAHKNFVVSTGTSSGKSLCYQLPMVDAMLKSNTQTGLLMFPTKALTNDQMNGIHNLVDNLPGNPIIGSIYDGDTPQRDRSSVRTKANILLTNPDMLHIGILPHHPLWERFFRNLSFIVIDEIHIYRGIFGSHVANLIRRLRRITDFYRSDPIYIMTSATIQNPADLGSKLIEKPVELIDQDGSPQGKKYFLVYNPPLINDELGIREGLLTTTARFLSLLYPRDIQSLVFCRTRRFVEILLRDVRSTLKIPANRIRGYRSGYLKTERREIETGLKDNEIKIGVATNALELGVDIGGVDAVLLPGYPGTVAALWQRAGRAGRKFQPSLAIFITSMNPLDQYLARKPEYLLSQNPEEALINPNNLLILLEHIKCSAAELPFYASDRFGDLNSPETTEYLDYLVTANLLHKAGAKYYWVSDDYPSRNTSLRSSAAQSILLKAEDDDSTVVIGEVDYNSGLWMVHQGAIYIHDGETYHVDELDLDHSLAILSPCIEDYLTEPILSTQVEVISEIKSYERDFFTLHQGEISVQSRVEGFKRIKSSTREVIDMSPLELPQTTLLTTGFWLVLKETCISQLRSDGFWQSDRNNYGPNWNEIRNIVRKRDGYICTVCGKRESMTQHHVHHKVPFRLFTSIEKANSLENLTTLCENCHSMAESQVRIRTALSGLNTLLSSLAPLMVMSDTNDLVGSYDPAARFAENMPAIIIYDNVPAGIGLADNLYQRFDELLEKARYLVESCECMDGCPSCVGPALETSYGGKKETQQLIKYLQE